MPSQPCLLSKRFGPRRPCLVVNPGGGTAAPRALWLQPSGENNFPLRCAHSSRDKFFSPPGSPLDRKSTRLNSSHSQISYAVFCLKKKKNKTNAKYKQICYDLLSLKKYKTAECRSRNTAPLLSQTETVNTPTVGW